MQTIIQDFLRRNVPQIADKIDVQLTGKKQEYYKIRTRDGILHVGSRKSTLWR